MQKLPLSEYLWGEKSSVFWLFFAAFLMLFIGLSGREIWTQEHRWSDIVANMLYYRDYLHPRLEGTEYYDKPLLSYWFIVLFAKLMGGLSALALRLPSALAGLIAIGSIYRLGTLLVNKRLGLLAGWMLLTTFYFIFWARTSSADMLNMAGTLLAVTWYFEKKQSPSFFSYTLFFLIMALTALCKGLVGPVVVVIALLPDLVYQQAWKKHLNFSVFFALIPAAIVYVLPFWASTHFGGQHYQENGLYLVYKENILRYFQPFDHKGPLYTYFVFLPVYLLPWAFFFIPALCALPKRWKTMQPNARWLVWSVGLLFLFFTLSGSRRNYYILPLVPFALLMTADWLLQVKTITKTMTRACAITVFFYLAFFFHFAVLQPWYYSGGFESFSHEVKSIATEQQPWQKWPVVLLDAESKVIFYLQLAPNVPFYGINQRNKKNVSIVDLFPVLKHPQPQTIYITRKRYVSQMKSILPQHQIVEARMYPIVKHFQKDQDLPVAFIPVSST